MLELSVRALFYLEDSRKIHLQGVRALRSKDAKRRVPKCVRRARARARMRERERERESKRARELALAPLFICPPPAPAGPVLCKLGQPGVLFVLPEVLTPVFGPSFVLFSRAFLFLVF